MNDRLDGSQAPKKEEPPSRAKRIWALIGAIAMIILTIAYAYSIATGNVFKW